MPVTESCLHVAEQTFILLGKSDCDCRTGSEKTLPAVIATGGSCYNCLFPHEIMWKDREEDSKRIRNFKLQGKICM